MVSCSSLKTYGMPSPLPFASAASGDVAQVLDAMYRLLQQRRADAEAVDSLRERLAREEREAARLRAERQAAQSRYDSLDQSKAILEAKLDRQRVAYGKEKVMLEQRVEQLEKRCLQLQHRDAQYLAAAKRQEKEFARLQKQLKTAAGARDRDTKQRMELAQKLQAPGAAGGARRGWKAARGTARDDMASVRAPARFPARPSPSWAETGQPQFMAGPSCLPPPLRALPLASRSGKRRFCRRMKPCAGRCAASRVCRPAERAVPVRRGSLSAAL